MRDGGCDDALSTKPSATIPWSQIGAKASADYQGEGLSVLPALEGARLCCSFQKLEGQATAEGLWLTSTADGAKGDRFRVVATSVGRAAGTVERGTSECPSVKLSPTLHAIPPLPLTGTMVGTQKFASFVRPGLVEEYSVSVEGVRQDLLVLQRPAGEGKLRVELEVTGARAEPLADGARLVLDGSGRKIA